jgi:hypothetical protein
MTFAMVNVLPLPVMPSRVWWRWFASTPRTSVDRLRLIAFAWKSLRMVNGERMDGASIVDGPPSRKRSPAGAHHTSTGPPRTGRRPRLDRVTARPDSWRRRLALRELEALRAPCRPYFLRSFSAARRASESRSLQGLAALGVGGREGARDAVPHRLGLALWPPPATGP